MTRAELLTYLSHEFAEIGTELSITWADDLYGIKTVLDSSMDALGSDTVDANARALGDFYLLTHAWRKASMRTDFDTTGIRGTRSQMFQHIKDMLIDAKVLADDKGLLDDGDDIAFEIARTLPERLTA